MKKVGILESRSKAKNAIIKVNGKEKKLSYEVKVGDEIEIILENGNCLRFQVHDIPTQNVPRNKRQLYFNILGRGKEQGLAEKQVSFLKWLFENH